MILNFPDLAKRITMPTDLGKPDWSKALSTILARPDLVPNGTQDDPTIVRVPEMLNAVSSIEPHRKSARHIHIICDEGAGFHFRTLGPGHDGTTDYITDVTLSAENALAVKEWRTRFLLGPVGGHGWKYQGILRGPKLAGMPARSPSYPGSTKTKNVLEAQHAFWGKDFGKQRTDEEKAAGVLGWDLSGCDFGWVWGDAISPGTVKPNDTPAEGLFVMGSKFHDLGRIGLLIGGLRDWRITRSLFGAGIPSSIVHSETSHNAPRLIGDGMLDRCGIRSGGYTVHVSGEMAELENLTIDRCNRIDRQHGIYIDMGPPLEDGTRRGRDISFTNNTHQKWVNGLRLGYYQNCQDVTHTGNSGPYGKTITMSKTLYHHGSKRITLAPNDYRRMVAA